MPDPSQLDRPWLRSYPPGVPPAYAYPDVPVTRFLDDAARDFPDVVATSYRRAATTYAELLDQVDRLATGLAELGIGPGRRVAIALPNLPAFPIALFAVLRLGAVAVPHDPGHHDDRLHLELKDAGAEAIVCEASLVPRVLEHRARLRALHHVIVTVEEDWLPLRRRLVGAAARRLGRRYRPRPGDEVRWLSQLIDANDPIARQASVRPDDPAVLAFTARSRSAVVLTHANLVANAFQARLWVPDIQAGRERVLAAAPLARSHGLTVALISTVLAAGTVVLAEAADDLGAVVAAERPSLFPGTPELFSSLDASGADLGSLRACLSGGAALPAELAERLEARSGARVRQTYGLTEATSLTHANPIYGRGAAGRVGLPVTDTVAAIVDLDDPAVLLQPGQEGELVVHGPQVAERRWQDPDHVTGALVDGWLLTGDVATMDEGGSFAVLGRRGPRP